MIKSKIANVFRHQYDSINSFTDRIHIVDYTDKTKNLPIKRSVEIYSPNEPSDIFSFRIDNPNNISIDSIIFDNLSFVLKNGKSRSQCEAVVFPTVSCQDSWILFCELKYSVKPRKNSKNIRKAIKQLYRTQYYFRSENIINFSNICYLVVSLPLQGEPFPNFTIPQSLLINLKNKKNIILRLKNSLEITNQKLLYI